MYNHGHGISSVVVIQLTLGVKQVLSIVCPRMGEMTLVKDKKFSI
jgi:hypothetical protein